MKRVILILMIGLSLFACSDDNDCCTNVDTKVDIKYLNTEGQNLFEISNGYNESNITVYHKINGEWSEYYKGNLDSPKGIKVINGENGKILSISPSTTLNESNYSETKIQFSESDFDIIKAEVDESNSNLIVTKVLYNDILKWKFDDGERMFEVIK